MRFAWLDRESLTSALDSLLAHRLRAALSATGIITGVGTVVAALAITSGAREQAMAEIGQLGVDNILVRATSDGAAKARRASVLDHGDADAIRHQLPAATVAVLRMADDAARVGDRTMAATVAGVGPEWIVTAGMAVGRGRWLDHGDAGRRAAVIGGVIADRLFQGNDPLGQLIEVAGEWRTIVGILPGVTSRAARPAGAVQVLDTGRTVFVPVSSLDLSIGEGDTGETLSQIVARVPAGGDVGRAAAAVTAVLASRHDPQSRFYEVVVPQELLRARLGAERSFHLLLLAVGVLALVVSGVGIMNIMVASVTERASEIGIRRAFGARRSAILRQFATEAGILSAVAGAIGVPVGLSGAFVAAWFAGWPVAVTVTSVVVAFGLAIAVGLAAAVYPARLAADLSPTEALRA